MQHTISSSTPLTFASVRVGPRSYRVCAASLPSPDTSRDTETTPTQSSPARPTASPTPTPTPTPSQPQPFSAAIHHPTPAHFRHVIGPRGATVAAIRAQCGPGIDIHVTGPTSADPAVRIRGTSEAQVAKAKHLILDILHAAHVRDSPYTHFLALPIPAPSHERDVHERLAALQAQVMAQVTPTLPAGVRVAPIPPTEMHLTLLMLRLPTPALVARAAQVLKSLLPSVYDAVGTQTVVAGLRGLHTFGDRRRAALLYVGVDEGEADRVGKLTRVLVDGFAKEELVLKDEARMPSFHLTLIRAKADNQGADGGKRVGNARPTFDATQVLDKYRDTLVVTKLRIPSVQLLRREKVNGPEGSQYVLEAEISLP